jgi:hypothetical protein
MQLEDVIRAVNALDLKTFSLENVEILQRMLPTETEVSFGCQIKTCDNLRANKLKKNIQKCACAWWISG